MDKYRCAQRTLSDHLDQERVQVAESLEVAEFEKHSWIILNPGHQSKNANLYFAKQISSLKQENKMMTQVV